jgi:CspA family cold shock protein
MTIGTVKFFNSTKGFGFISPEGGGKDAFVHISAVERAGLGGLNEGDKVSYDLESGQPEDGQVATMLWSARRCFQPSRAEFQMLRRTFAARSIGSREAPMSHRCDAKVT